ncbi:hypothetical protein A3D84_03875 [Candidatus Woesebacteria bacterium RIFCSPHIGHO2_02_FULL_42_20]|uniref:SH3b domain-containing protein n=1 Tax=Candidatus Woesebacteria bacterium RIFCSPHIGHO2_12_FULL_41_24 TaxID=1802510 RepID=A0A1F8AU59_9BACT|nr:MAG: hypothetical protein A2W15_04030 [Candidatus Woesebacteria bacterium RBG_16_41_13]OGM29126.1 MAG: hypothetical protein A2873_00135 [Candidatus Woesebacteria bacterium RIFCSPHIGHO2_01_FULL_42_80]OGM35671.1 MAG: hypothetical protein A3D84_03875 [Candidatus Woesebacteria bacterium RIFCSPHIGHO2_02_FULL_42_20]OGM55282.1 MAG: hypothetical protein A3E44_03285 [Candidatus Woesebacteria bacterium RIFCSPHIGHO2_12_FULL_41_24]OGM66804.1 MAG: hypothetical protein A2969_00135 [Candidatus Woesebacteri
MRKKLKISLFVVSGVGILITISFLVLRLIKPPKAALLVESSPNSTAFVNGEQVGRTPYEGEFSAGEVVIKLIPDSFESPLAPYQSTVDLVAGIKTVVRRSFGDTDDTSAGEVVSFERIGGDKASLSVISIPDGAQVSLDSQTRGRTPIKITDLETKEYHLEVAADGYQKRDFVVKAVSGYLLTAEVKLAAQPGNVEGVTTPEVPEEPTEETVEKVKILTTPTGFLRVRQEPTTQSVELGQVVPGEEYILLAIDEKSGWFKIEYETDKEGWVTNQYARKVENNPEASPSPSPSPTPIPKASPSPTPIATP